MAKVNLFCSDVNRRGQKIVLPIAGEVQVSNEGIVEVEQEVADFMVQNGGGGWEIKGEKIAKKEDAEKSDKKKADSKKKEKVEEEEDEDESEDEQDDDQDEDDSDEDSDEGEDEPTTKEQLEALDLKELIDLAKSSDIPADEYKKFKASKPLMVNFLLKKNS